MVIDEACWRLSMRWSHSIRTLMILKSLVHICRVMDMPLNLNLVLCFILVFFPESYQVIRYYNERHYGKGPMSDIGGCVKNIVFLAVLSEKVVINSHEDFSRYADSNIKGVLVLFIPTSEITEEPDFIRETPHVESMCTLKVHIFKSFKTKAGFYCLEFFKTVTNDILFILIGIATLVTCLIHVVIWTYQYIIQSMKSV